MSALAEAASAARPVSCLPARPAPATTNGAPSPVTISNTAPLTTAQGTAENRSFSTARAMGGDVSGFARGFIGIVSAFSVS